MLTRVFDFPSLNTDGLTILFMTNEQQRIAIAEACGWNCLGMVTLVGVGTPYLWQHLDGRTIMHDHLPDYPNDLNAMHESVEGLSERQKQQYEVYLEEIVCGNVCQAQWPMGRLAKVSNATAAQRAEAFLRTLNLWKE
jgi:hypothetical protein